MGFRISFRRCLNRADRSGRDRKTIDRSERTSIDPYVVANHADGFVSYNMAPRQRAPVIRREHDAGTPMIETM